jgi:hypothetical protein
MAWRIHESVIRGEIDNRVRDQVTGRIWMVGLNEPVTLELKGNPWRDLAGHRLTFTNADPKPGTLAGFFQVQKGVVGDMTASRKVKVPEVSIEELMRLEKAGLPWRWQWANSLYVEWFSEHNGRVVIESASYQLEIDVEESWAMDEAMECEQMQENDNGCD